MLAIVVFAVADQILPRVGHIAQTVFILPALGLLLAGVRPGILRVPALFLLAALLVQLSSWWFTPELAGYEREASPKLDRLARWMLFLFIAFWLVGRAEVLSTCGWEQSAACYSRPGSQAVAVTRFCAASPGNGWISACAMPSIRRCSLALHF
ncbi:MAG: hypothetical protein R6W80_08020 [Haliea sp.]